MLKEFKLIPRGKKTATKFSFIRTTLAFILTLTMVCPLLPQVALAEDSGSILQGDYHFVDIAYSPTLKMYVAAAKGEYTNSNKTYKTKLYYSTDKFNWTPAFTTDATTSNFAPSLKSSVEWWADEQLFVAYGSGKLYYSSNGINWTADNTGQRGDGGIVKKDGQLVVFGGRAINIPNRYIDTANSGFTLVIFAAGSASFYPTAMGISKIRDDNTKQYVMANGYYTFSLTAQYNPITNTYTYTPIEQTNSNATLNNIGGKNPYDFVYNDKRDEWLLIYGDTSLKVFRGAVNTYYTADVDLAGAANESPITTAYINDDYIFIGLENGKIYRTPNTGSEMKSSAEWTEVVNKTGTTPNSEAVSNIKEGEQGEFIISTSTQLYVATESEYFNINEYMHIGDVEVSANPFAGVTLLGGAYSPRLGLHVVYGNTPNSGLIYSSQDGIKWTLRHSDQMNLLNQPNSAVWWEKEGLFVIESATSHSGTSWISNDGVSWSHSNTKFGSNMDIAVSGDYLYSGNNQRKLYKYDKISSDTREEIDISPFVTAEYFQRLGVGGGGESPAILAAAYAEGVMKAKDSDTWIKNTNISNGGSVRKIKYIDKLEKFVVTSDSQRMTIVNPTDAAVANGPAQPAGALMQYVEANEDRYIFGANNGGLYTAVNDVNFDASTPLTKVPLSAEYDEENIMPVTNLFVGKGGKFIATVSNKTDSDVLLVDSAAGSYVKVSDLTEVEALNVGDSLTVKIPYINKPAEDIPVNIIVAIYSGDRLVQTTMSPLVIKGGMGGELIQKITVSDSVPEDAYMKVFLWNSLGELKPLISHSDFFVQGR